jgi:hypothetical protein
MLNSFSIFVSSLLYIKQKTQMSTRKNTLKERTKDLAIWTGAWLFTMAIASFGPKLLWDFNNSFSILAIVLNLLVGIGMIVANKNHILAMDELEKKIHFESMAVTLGLAVVAGLAYSNLDLSNVISGNAEISHVVILIGISYFVGILIGTKRYQ